MKHLVCLVDCLSRNDKHSFCLLFILISLFLVPVITLKGQIITYDFPVAQYNLRVTIDESGCHDCQSEWPADYNAEIWGGISYDPAGILYGVTGNLGDNTLYEMDPVDSLCTPVFTPPTGLPNMLGLVAMGSGIFYSMVWQSDTLYRWDVNAGTVTQVGTTGFPCWSEMCISNGSVYYFTREFIPPNSASVVKIDLINPANSVKVVDFNSSFGIFANTATTDPNALYAVETWMTGGANLYRLSLIDGSLSFVCKINPPNIGGAFPQISSPLEHNLFSPGLPFIDLDCDDSSGTSGSDFNSIPYDCLSDGSYIIDIDPRIRSDAIVQQMTVRILMPMPDLPFEILEVIGAVTNINVTGTGTSMLTFVNSGNGTLNDFLQALSYVIYRNNSFNITPGMRTVEVQFTSFLGTLSNKAKAYIDVDNLPHVVVDLGPDIEACEGDIIHLSVNNPGEEYIWSTGEDTEEIIVDQPGQYVVTVTSTTLCPARDTIEVEFLPVVQVWLSGDTATCPDGAVQLIITTDAPFPITVTVTPDPGDPFVLEDIMGTFQFVDYPFGITEYYITEVLTSQPACVVLPDPDQVIEVWPTYSGVSASATLCLGDSILLGNTFYSDSGVYAVAFETIHDCDSIVNYSIDLLPTEHIYIQGTTCDPAMAGTVLSFLPNPNGCDTVVHTTLMLLRIDTTSLILTSCKFSETGIFIDTLTNQFGCDSFLVTNISYDVPADTTLLVQYTCDSASVGVFVEVVSASDGCDSIIQTQTTIPVSDTTLIFLVSCDPANVGVSQLLWNGFDGCDSLVITTTSLAVNDTTLLFTTSCDSADLGIFVSVFPIANSCDSIVVTQVDFSLADSTYLFTGSCFVADTGLFTVPLMNRFGCDSFVINTISLFPSHQFDFASSSCNPVDTGSFVQYFTNQFGCDSVVSSQVSLLPSNTSDFHSFTCDENQAGQFMTILQNQFGCDSTIVLTIDYIEPDTTIKNLFTCNPNEVGSTETVFQNIYGCDSLLIQVTDIYTLPQVEINALTDFHGFDVSCFGASDAILSADVVGLPPIQYSWSIGSDQPMIAGLAAGVFTVSISDVHDCGASDEIILTEPPPLEMHLMVSEPGCFESEMGTIMIEAEGGIPSYQYSIDSISFHNDAVFSNLPEGIYILYVKDGNDCIASEIIGVNIPFPVEVELGDNQVLDIGDTTVIIAMVNVEVALLDSIKWNGTGTSGCDTCLQQIVAPFITTSYSISVINEDGCQAEDQITITVVKNGEIYVPNVFSPNGDGINDEVLISTGSFVEKILQLQIFDRWGNQVYAITDLEPQVNLPTWDGTYLSRTMNSAVFAYRLVARLRDGSSSILVGDITLLR
ncbi:MAG TPA: gliding motility-associated C-terminal domain-containing protein [Saprospiraceae bacterium]|nr:gliding motility-associated C-terminal domain-containing protein [Saprospiraceae bacterium]